MQNLCHWRQQPRGSKTIYRLQRNHITANARLYPETGFERDDYQIWFRVTNMESSSYRSNDEYKDKAKRDEKKAANAKKKNQSGKREEEEERLEKEEAESESGQLKNS